ncbi:MAG TPA: Crp/Fnr family transcriptional regulator [Burkholderiaceae bacterium]|nr:Crp/Fnr family transcriptional regulator [Burkholderiaceae bacterium]
MIDVLAGVPLFAGLNRAELAPLAAMAVTRSYPRNLIVVNEGDRADTLYFVLSGRLKVFVASDDGREIVLSTQGPGTYFGDMMLDDGVRSASVMTLEPCRLAALSRGVFRDFLAHHPDTALALIKNLIHRTRSMNDRLRDLAVLDVYGRVAKLLLSLARPVDGRLIIEERVTQQEIGERIGASREMVSRILKDMKAGGYVRMEGRRIVILRKPPRTR